MAVREIVGVVADVRTNTSTTVLLLFYQPLLARDDVFGHISRDPRASQPAVLLLKTDADLSTQVAQIVQVSMPERAFA